MIELANEMEWAAKNSDIIMALLTVYPNAYFNARSHTKGEIEYSMSKPDLEHLADKGVSERIISDQVFVANRVNELVGGIRGQAENFYSSILGRLVSGNSRHSLVLMCSYGEGSPLQDLKLGRYLGNDVLKGNPVDLKGEDREVRSTLKEIRSREGVGSLVINGHFSLYHSGVQLPPMFNLERKEYTDSVEVGSRTEAMLEFSRSHPSYSRNPVWFYKKNGKDSIIQNGQEYALHKDN